MGVLRFLMADQLTRQVSSLAGLAPGDVVLMVEVAGEATAVRHHKQKIAFLFSAMRHFATALGADGVTVDYVRLDDPANTQTFAGEVTRAVARHGPEAVIVTEPGEWRVLEDLHTLRETLAVPLHIREDDRFLCSRETFERWARGRKSFRMEFFYRDMRRQTGFLMEGDAPAGGAWNFDADNRKRLPPGLVPPARAVHPPDAITREVIDLVARRFCDHFGDLAPFRWAVTREGALAELDDFIARSLPLFGDYQDAMRAGEPFLYHAVLSPYLNCGLLTAREVCERAEAAWRAGQAPLNAVEGFIRQVLGWREFVRGLYWHAMPDYAATNHLDAHRPLPRFFWTGATDMACLSDAIGTTRRHAYAHHIQRLMVIGNFALLAGLSPAAVQEWFLIVYADAYEWVELPNVQGMVLHADGGQMASKPYAASGAYINRMSDHCGTCRYRVSEATGPDACPFNSLYWHFLMVHEAKLSGNPRMAMPYRTLDRMDPERRLALADAAQSFLAGLEPAVAGRDW